MTLAINGVIPVLPTPFNDDESIGFASVGSLIDFAVASNAAAICVPAYGSEFYKLSDAERDELVGNAIQACTRRVPVVAQANHTSARIAGEIARRYESYGADVIGIALPRQFPTTDADLMRYCGRVAESVSIPILVQDFNPGGPTIGAGFLCDLHRAHPNVLFAKLEEPLIATKLQQVFDRVGDSIGLLTGWGGLYLLDGLAANSRGVMPGVAICDLFATVWAAARDGADPASRFSRLLPYITYGLQTFELFLAMEKHMLVRRGIIPNARCRELTRTIDPPVWQRATRICDELLVAVNENVTGRETAI